MGSKTNTAKGIQYRKDIDGLRAIAVLAVIFFHLGLARFFSSGYTGVDIFFVISGYLITSIIYKEMTSTAFSGDISGAEKPRGQFSLLEFYERRVRRIIPVFLVVIITSLFLIDSVLSSMVRREFTNSVFSTVLFGANFFFWGDEGYFALESHSKPLLHMWSLAIEEQFYIVYPLFLAFLVRKNKHCVKYLAIIAIISFVACVVMSFIQSKTAFYWTPFRVWELLLGGILALLSVQNGVPKNVLKVENPKLLQLLSLFALFLLVFSITNLHSIGTVFPSYIALVPCVAAVLCIELGKNPNSLVYKVLSLAPLQFVGKISYSLYLWHWVVIVFNRLFYPDTAVNVSVFRTLSLLGITFALSCLSYVVIEQPVRKKKIFKKRRTLFFSMFAVAVLVCLGSFAVKKELVSWSFLSDEVKYFRDFRKTDQKNVPAKETILGHAELVRFGSRNVEPTLFVIGDSHAEQLFAMLDLLGKEHNVGGIFYADTKTPLFNTLSPSSIPLIPSPASDILSTHKKIQEYLRTQNIKSVLFAVRWTMRVYDKEIYNLGDETRARKHNLYYINSDESFNRDSVFAVKQGLEDTMDIFNPQLTRFFMLKSLPEFTFYVPDYAGLVTKRMGIDKARKEVVSSYSDYEKLHKDTFRDLSFLEKQGVVEIDLAKNICDESFCYGLSEENVPLYIDDDHLSVAGTILLKENFLPFILAGKVDTEQE